MRGLRTLITVSHDSSRFKEFAKRGATRLVMPRYSLNELRSIGKYMLNDTDHENVEAVSDLFDDASIISRYRRHGGIFRRVLVNSALDCELNELARKEAMRQVYTQRSNTNFNKPEEITETGGHVVQQTAHMIPAASNANLDDREKCTNVESVDFDPTKWTYDFEKLKVQFSSQSTRQELISQAP